MPGKDLHLPALRCWVRDDRSGILLEVLAADAVPEDLTQRAVDVVRRPWRKLLPPRADGGRLEPVHSDVPEGIDGVLQSVPQRLEGDVLGDVLFEVLRDEG